MRMCSASARLRGVVPIAIALLLASAGFAWGQQGRSRDSTHLERFELYGFSQGDMGFSLRQNDPRWFDVNRPTKLPAFKNEFGRDGRFWGSVRQSRLGVRTFIPTRKGELRTIFEWDLFGVGTFAGETTIRPRTFYGEIGQFGAGQYFSPFMDIDVFPNIIEYWGPNGMVFFRNIQVRWMPIRGTNRLTFALERPGASADKGDFADRIELENVVGRFPVPDVSGEYRHGTPWGYVELAGIVRYMRIDDITPDTFNFNQNLWGWGLSLSSNVNFNRKLDVLRLEIVYGRGIENYMNDAPVDVGAEREFNNPRRPVSGEPLPILGLVAYLDHRWDPRWTSSIGWSMANIWNSDGQLSSAFHRGQYASANVIYYPVKHMLLGWELQYGRRVNFEDSFQINDFRLQFAAKYDFSFTSSRRADDREGAR